jgi:hypothetical protein
MYVCVYVCKEMCMCLFSSVLLRAKEATKTQMLTLSAVHDSLTAEKTVCVHVCMYVCMYAKKCICVCSVVYG